MKILHLIDSLDGAQKLMSDGLRSRIDNIDVLDVKNIDVYSRLKDSYDVVHAFSPEIAIAIKMDDVHIVTVEDRLYLHHYGFKWIVESAVRIVSSNKGITADIHKKHKSFNHQTIPIESPELFSGDKQSGAYEQLYFTVFHEAMDSGFAVIESNIDNKVSLFSFGGLGTRYNFLNILRRIKSNKVFLRDIFNSWYLRGIDNERNTPEDLVALLLRLYRMFQTPHNIFIGDSAGASAAIIFGNLAMADAVIAFNPQSFLDINLRDEYKDHRWKSLADPVLNDGLSFDLVEMLQNHNGITKYYVFYSNGFEPDKIHAERLAGLPHVHIIPIDCDHHGVAGALKDMGLLNKILQEACEEFSFETIKSNFNI